MVKHLLELGADPSIKNKKGSTPKDMTETAGIKSLFKDSQSGFGKSSRLHSVEKDIHFLLKIK